jgi:glucokinase
MTALASSLVLLEEGDLLCLQEGDGEGGDVCGVLAPGTGLGEGFLLKNNRIFYPKGTEGGHSDFAPVGEEQQRLLAWLGFRTRETISYEMVCAGPAIGTLYEFYVAEGVAGSAEVRAMILQADDRTPVIIQAALDGSCPLCARVLDLFLRILGREGANIVMKMFCTGGLFLGGGIFPRLAGNVSLTPFLDAFRKEGTMSGLTEKTPVNIIMRQDAALLGAACYCRMKVFNQHNPDGRTERER